MAKCGWLSFGAVNGSGPSASEWLGLSCARLCGWLDCSGFQTLLVSMLLSAGQQKGHPSSWRRLPLRRVAAAGWLESGSECRCVRRAEIEEASDDGKTVSRSFLCLGFVVSQSVIPVELFCCLAGQSMLWRECVVLFVIIKKEK